MSRQDNIQNIISLINSQMESMNSYSLTISRMMGNINNSINELIHLQEYVEMGRSIDRYYNSPRTRTTSNISPIRPVRSTNPDVYSVRSLNRNNRDSTRGTSYGNTINRRTTNYRGNRDGMPTLNPLFNRRPLVQPIRRMNLQEFINSTLNQGNITIPATNNQIMQETSIVNFEDLLDTDSTSCPISLVSFDSSSNILRINRCGHVFDANFLRRWFRQDSRCPVCRYNINNEDHSETETQNPIQTNRTTTHTTPTQSHTTGLDPRNQNALIYDISFSIPQLFGRDMSENQINSVINSITDAITNTMNSSGLHSGSIDLGNDVQAVVESVSLQNTSDVNNVSSTLASSWSDMTDDSDDEEI